MPRTSTKSVRPLQIALTDPEYISVKGAAGLLTVSQVSIRRWLREGRLKKFKAGSRTLVRRQDVLGLVREG
jgi:excisionase family DNA binding protein